jgi:hypothetical protein
MACLIGSESLFDCANKPVGGVNNYAMLYNYTQWRTMVENGLVTFAADGTINDIANSVGVQAFRFDMPDETAMVLGMPDRLVDGGIDGFDHAFSMSILGTKQAKKNILVALSFEKAVAVVYRKNQTGEVYGGEQGLKPTANTYNPNDPSIGSVIPVQMATSPRTPAENLPPADVFKTDAATTKALIEGLNKNNNKEFIRAAAAEQAKKAEELAAAEQAKKAEKKYKVKEHIFPNQKSRNYFIDGKNVTLVCGEEVSKEIVNKFPSQASYFEEI